MFWLTDAAAAEITLAWREGDTSAWRWTEKGTIDGHAVTLDESWHETVLKADVGGATVSMALDALIVTLDGNLVVSLSDVPKEMRTIELSFDRQGVARAAMVPVAIVDGAQVRVGRMPGGGIAASAGKKDEPASPGGRPEIELVPLTWWNAAAVPSGDLSVGRYEDRRGVRTKVDQLAGTVAVLRLAPTPIAKEDPDEFLIEGVERPQVRLDAADVVDLDVEQRVDFVKLRRLRIEGRVVRSFVGSGKFATFDATGTLERR